MRRSPAAARNLSAEERTVLERAVRYAAVDGAQMPALASIDALQVVSSCGCGCASVTFRHLQVSQIADLVADAVAETATGAQVGVLVFALAGEFIEMEIVAYSEDPAPLPVAIRVRGWGEVEPDKGG